jgi:DNA-binding transcriptional LysR family regulator
MDLNGLQTFIAVARAGRFAAAAVSPPPRRLVLGDAFAAIHTALSQRLAEVSARKQT